MHQCIVQAIKREEKGAELVNHVTLIDVANELEGVGNGSNLEGPKGREVYLTVT